MKHQVTFDKTYFLTGLFREGTGPHSSEERVLLACAKEVLRTKHKYNTVSNSTGSIQ